MLIKDTIEGIEKKNNALTHEIEEVKKRSTYLPELEAKTREMKNVFEDSSRKIEELTKARDQLRAKADMRRAELERFGAQYKHEQSEIEKLRIT